MRIFLGSGIVYNGDSGFATSRFEICLRCGSVRAFHAIGNGEPCPLTNVWVRTLSILGRNHKIYKLDYFYFKHFQLKMEDKAGVILYE